MRISKLIILFAGILLLTACVKKENINKNDSLFWNKNTKFSQSEEVLKKEIENKIEKLKSYLTKNKYEAMLITQVRNFNWVTAGIAHNQIVLNKDVGAASLLILKNGEKYLLCNGSESGRLMDETLGKLGYKLLQYNWYESNPVKDVRGKMLRSVVPKGTIASDVAFPETKLDAGAIKALRLTLSDSELERYRWVNQQTTEAIQEVCKKIKPGMNEYEIEAITSAEIRARGIFPTVLLTAVDERIYNYRHALPGGAVLKKYAMINVCAEKWGMPVAVTRFVHFGELDKELKNKIEQCAIVNSKYQQATKPNTASLEVFDGCKKWYAEAGFEGEWKKHHQGGAIGYDDREWVIYPGIKEMMHNKQAFAWNPTITGAKVEDTIFITENGFEVLTKAADWPYIIVELDGKKYPQPTILIRDAKTLEVVKKEDYIIKAN